MNQRLKGAGERGSRYLFIHGIQRFREFRRTEDEMSFGRRGADKIVTPLEHLQSLLRDGPGVGIHVLMWCDMLVNLNRTLDRQGLRECGYRVVFQMNAADSSHLLDSPAASKLGRNRALLFHDEMAQPEKFRPYGLPLPGLARCDQSQPHSGGAGASSPGYGACVRTWAWRTIFLARVIPGAFFHDSPPPSKKLTQ